MNRPPIKVVYFFVCTYTKYACKLTGLLTDLNKGRT